MHHFLEDIWENLMIANSLVIWPATFIFLIYAAGRALVTLHGKLLVVAAIIFAVDTIVQVAIGLIVD